jgi:hypothetical protein
LAVWETCFAVLGMTGVILAKVHVCVCDFAINVGVDVVLIV